MKIIHLISFLIILNVIKCGIIKNPPNHSDFYCFGNSNKTANGETDFFSNELYYPALPTLILNQTTNQRTQSLTRYIPEACSKHLHESTNREKKSCCFQENRDKYEKIINSIYKASKGGIIECTATKNWLPLSYGFRNVTNTGETPDLEVNSISTYLRAYDTRYHVKTCIEHLKELQCYKCSQDHNTILQEPDETYIKPTQEDDYDNLPMFYMNANMTMTMTISSNNEDASQSYNKENVGKSLTICQDYYQELSKYCKFIRFKEIMFDQYFKESPSHNFAPDQETGYTTIDVPALVKTLFVSPDKRDALYISNINCFSIPIKPYTEPICSFIHNNAFINDYRSDIEKDINGQPILDPSEDIGFQPNNPSLSPSILSNINLIQIIIITIIKVLLL